MHLPPHHFAFFLMTMQHTKYPQSILRWNKAIANVWRDGSIKNSAPRIQCRVARCNISNVLHISTQQRRCSPPIFCLTKVDMADLVDALDRRKSMIQRWEKDHICRKPGQSGFKMRRLFCFFPTIQEKHIFMQRTSRTIIWEVCLFHSLLMVEKWWGKVRNKVFCESLTYRIWSKTRQLEHTWGIVNFNMPDQNIASDFKWRSTKKSLVEMNWPPRHKKIVFFVCGELTLNAPKNTFNPLTTLSILYFHPI